MRTVNCFILQTTKAWLRRTAQRNWKEGISEETYDLHETVLWNSEPCLYYVFIKDRFL